MASGGGQKYDRDFLLLGSKRNEVLELWEVERYGIDTFDDPHHVSVFGMRPSEWYARGVRLLGRTAVECTRDQLADMIGKDIAAFHVHSSHPGGVLVIDPFLGSANTLYWILRHIPGALGLGVELDERICAFASENLARLALLIELVNTDYRAALTKLKVPTDLPIIVFVAPPWGEALTRKAGLNLRRTDPPIREIVDRLLERFRSNPLLCAIQILELLDEPSLREVEEAFDWSAMRIYPLNSTYGYRPGLLLGGARK